MKNRRQITILTVSGVGLALTVTGFLFLRPNAIAQSGTPAEGKTQTGTPRLLVEAIRPRKTLTAATITLSGQIDADRTATVAAEVADRILSRPVERGDRVEAGQAIATLNEDLARATLAQAEATVERVEAAVRQAQAEYDRAAIETQAAISQATAQVQAAKAAELKAKSYTRRQELLSAQAALDAVKAEEALAQKDYERYATLVKEDTLPRQALDRAKTALDATVAKRQSAEQSVSLAQEGARQEDIAAASAQVALAKAGLEATQSRPQRLAAIQRQVDALKAQANEARAGVEQARIALAKRRIVAPFGGRVLETLIERGEMASPGRAVVRIADVRTVKAQFAVPESLRSSLRVGQTVNVTADALPGKTFSGKVKVLGFEADKQSRTFPVEITVANPTEALLPGMVVRLSISGSTTAQQDTRITLPLTAVASDGNTSYVFALENGKAVRRDVALGKLVGTSDVEILAGLTGEETLVETPQRLTNNAQIEVAGNNK